MADSKFVTQENYNVGGHMTYGRTSKIDRIVVHHNASTVDNIPAVWQTRPASAHYQVTPTDVRQCVREQDTSWQAGSWEMNCRSIGIEHLNSSGAPTWGVADETLERSANLIADICSRHGIPCDSTHIIPHKSVVPTACPGGLDVGRLINRANEILGGKPSEVKPQENPTTTEASTGGWLFFDYDGNVREFPSTNSKVVVSYPAGTWVRFTGWVVGEPVNGSDKWLKSALHGWYVHSSVVGGTYGLPMLGEQAPKQASQTMVMNTAGNWRDEPTTNSGVFATYQAGSAVNCQGWVYGQDPYGDGNNRWVKSSRNGKYAWSGIFGGVGNLPYIGN